MAYMNQETKARIAPAVKAILCKYGMKGSLAVRNHTSLVLTVREGRLDVIGNWNARAAESGNTNGAQNGALQVNQHCVDANYTGEVREFINEIVDAMNDGNFDNSDSMTDYFHVGWYTDINVGTWDKPYRLVD